MEQLKMELHFKHHLRVVVLLLMIVPAVVLFLNAVFMQNFLTVETGQKRPPPINDRLQREIMKYRWLNAQAAGRERIRKYGESHPTKNRSFSLNDVQTRPNSEISVTFFAKFAYKRMKVLRNMARCLSSILINTNAPMHFHVLLDAPSGQRINRTMVKISADTKKQFKVSYHDVSTFDRFRPTISTFRQFFFTKDVGRYSDDLFFVSQMFHLAEPFEKLSHLIMIDLDIKFQADISELQAEFQKFESVQIMSLAHDQQPQYRFDFARYRAKHPGTDVGAPHPGKQGFNTGVVLFDLNAMRKSKIYNQLLKASSIKKMCTKYQFKGYMGHQDFYTLSGMEHPELYRVLNCTWNRQLDTGWKKTAGKEVFEQYHSCPGKVKVYHGNGEAFIPNS